MSTGAEAEGVGDAGATVNRGNSLSPRRSVPWNKGRLIGQKRPLKPEDVWTLRVRLQLEGRKRDLAMFNLAIDSKLRACDLVRLKIDDVCVGGGVRDRATVIQKKTGRPVQFEITEQTWTATGDWLFELAGRSRSTRARIREFLRLRFLWLPESGESCGSWPRREGLP